MAPNEADKCETLRERDQNSPSSCAMLSQGSFSLLAVAGGCIRADGYTALGLWGGIVLSPCTSKLCSQITAASLKKPSTFPY